MANEKFLRENLRYIVECRRFGKTMNFWVYHFGKSLYINGFWPERCHHSVQSADDLTRWMEKRYWHVVHVIPEKDVAKVTALLKAKADAVRIKNNQLTEASVHDKNNRAFRAKLPPDLARLMGGTSVVNYRTPNSDITYGSKKRSRK